MQRNKYLDDLGIPIEDYGVNFIGDKKDKRYNLWKRQQREYGFDARETWNLDTIFIEWLYCHCMMYKDQAKDVIVLDDAEASFDHKGFKYTQLQALNYIIKWTGEYLKVHYNIIEGSEYKLYDKVKKAVHLWAEILPSMWW